MLGILSYVLLGNVEFSLVKHFELRFASLGFKHRRGVDNAMTAIILRLIFACSIIFYIGECLGLYMQCDNLDDLQCVKSCVWLVPFLQLVLIFKTLVLEFKEKDFRCLLGLLTAGQSSTVILRALSDLKKQRRNLYE